MKYRYIEFTDMTAKNSNQRKTGKLWYVGDPSEELIKELDLTEQSKNRDGSGKIYHTTLSMLGEKGWELMFVTPCGINWAKKDSIAGPIENSYIFRKASDE